MIAYGEIIRASGAIEVLGNVSFETVDFNSIAPNGIAIARKGATSWPIIVLGATAQCLDASGNDASPLVLLKIRDAGSEQPYTADYISARSLFGPSDRSNPMRFIKPFLLTRNRRLEFEVKNAASSTVRVTITLWGIRHYGNPLQAQSRD